MSKGYLDHERKHVNNNSCNPCGKRCKPDARAVCITIPAIRAAIQAMLLLCAAGRAQSAATGADVQILDVWIGVLCGQSYPFHKDTHAMFAKCACQLNL